MIYLGGEIEDDLIANRESWIFAHWHHRFEHRHSQIQSLCQCSHLYSRSRLAKHFEFVYPLDFSPSSCLEPQCPLSVTGPSMKQMTNTLLPTLRRTRQNASRKGKGTHTSLTIQVRICLPKCTIPRIATETRPVRNTLKSIPCILGFPDKVKNSGKT